MFASCPNEAATPIEKCWTLIEAVWQISFECPRMHNLSALLLYASELHPIAGTSDAQFFLKFNPLPAPVNLHLLLLRLLE